MTKHIVTRIEAVQSQLNSAIRLYFISDDLISAVTLAGAAERVLSDMQPQDGILGVDAYSIRSSVNLHIKPEYQKRVAQFFRKDYDFFRHADHGPDQSLEMSELRVDFLLMIAISSYQFLGYATTPEMRAFLRWFMLRYPHVMKVDDEHRQLMTDINANTTGIPKHEVYQLLLNARLTYPTPEHANRTE
jgi:hypothetical protein